MAEGKVMEQAAGALGTAQSRWVQAARGALCPSSSSWCPEARAVPLSPAGHMGREGKEGG